MNMRSVFNHGEDFNQNLNKWNTSNVDNVYFIFGGVKNINRKIQNILKIGI